MDIQPIQTAVRQENIFFTDHALRQMIKRAITDIEVQETILSGEIIEEYPQDKYSPGCLILGTTSQNRRLHVVCSLPPRVRIITVYQPDSVEWIDYRHRKAKP
jgi:hypothetical protein